MKWKLGKLSMRVGLVAMALTVLIGISVAPAAAQSRKPIRPWVVRPDGPVWQVIRKNCTTCHGIDDYAFFALDRAGWQKLIEDKHKTDGIVLSDPDRNTLLDYLVLKFGPTSKAFPRTYIPPEITTFFSDPEARRLLDRACTSCHPSDRVDLARKSEEAWRVTAVDMRERGAKISDEELEQLVEWLGRARGTNQDK